MHFSYRFLRHLGLGAHLAVVIAFAAVPTSLLIVQFIHSERREAIEDAEEWARRAALRAAEHHSEAVATSRAVLEATAARLDFGLTAARPCAVPPGTDRVVWLVAPGGGSRCSSEPGFPLPSSTIEDVAEEADEPGFEVLGPYDGVGTARMQIFGSLTRRTADGVTWHVVQAIDLEWATAYDEELAEPADLVVMSLDERGRIFHRIGSGADLAPHPDAGLGLVQSVRQAPVDDDAASVVDVDGVRRIYGAADVPEAGVTVMVGVSHGAVVTTATQKLIASLAAFAAVLTLSGVLAWLVIERMVLRTVRQLRDAAVATARGEHSPRVEITDGPIELRELACAFNDMTDKLEFQAFHDQLTGLANRRYLEKRMGALLDDGRPFAVLAIDLDGFKPVNDTFGHAVGDFVLAEAARRLAAGLGDGLFIGRTGGDEFLAGILADGERKTEIAAETAGRMLAQLGRPITLADDTQVTISGSVGVAFWPGSGETADEVVRQADIALYRAKRSGRNQCVVPDAA